MTEQREKIREIKEGVVDRAFVEIEKHLRSKNIEPVAVSGATSREVSFNKKTCVHRCWVEQREGAPEPYVFSRITKRNEHYNDIGRAASEVTSAIIVDDFKQVFADILPC
jgi:hypothetical protein